MPPTVGAPRLGSKTDATSFGGRSPTHASEKCRDINRWAGCAPCATECALQISRTPGQARSRRLLVSRSQIPDEDVLEYSSGDEMRSSPRSRDIIQTMSKQRNRAELFRKARAAQARSDALERSPAERWAIVVELLELARSVSPRPPETKLNADEPPELWLELVKRFREVAT